MTEFPSPQPAPLAEDALPPLPIPYRIVQDADGFDVQVFRVFQLRDYARTYAERIQAAKPAQSEGASDELSEVIEWANKLGAIGHPDRAAAAIRELSAQRLRAPDGAAQSIASMVAEWVDGGISMGTDWRPGLADVITKRLARFQAPEGAPDLVRRLRGLVCGFHEWRVESPEDGSYCLSRTRDDCADPERECREWLEREKKTGSIFAGYVVKHHHVMTAKDKALAEAADALAALAAQPQASDRDADWTLAIGKAFGLDSGFSIPVTPSVEAFKTLFAAVAAKPAPAEGDAAAWVPKVLYGPRTHICWTPDHTPPEKRVPVVLISEADYSRACAALAAPQAQPKGTAADADAAFTAFVSERTGSLFSPGAQSSKFYREIFCAGAAWQASQAPAPAPAELIDMLPQPQTLGHRADGSVILGYTGAQMGATMRLVETWTRSQVAVQTPAVEAVELVAVIGEACGGVADGEEVIKQRLADALCAVVDRSGLKRKEVAQMLGVTEANLSIKLSGETNLTIMSVADICGAVGANLNFRVEGDHV
jgi:hypothetical protein